MCNRVRRGSVRVRRGSVKVRRGSVRVRRGSVRVRRGSVRERRGSDRVRRDSVCGTSARCKAGPQFDSRLGTPRMCLPLSCSAMMESRGALGECSWI